MVTQIMPELRKAVEDGKVRVVGPPTFVYLGVTGELDKPFDLEVGFPVAEGTPPAGRFQVRMLAALKCGSVEFTGPVYLIDKAYDRLVPAIQAAGLEPVPEAREVYLKWEGMDSPENQILVALG